MVPRQLRLDPLPHHAPWLPHELLASPPETPAAAHHQLLLLGATEGEATPWHRPAGDGAGARSQPVCGQAQPRRRIHRQPRGHRPAQEIPGPRGRGAGKDGRAILTLAPCLPPGWPQETGYGLGGSDSAHHTTCNSEGVKSLAPGCSLNPTPTISPNRPAGSRSQHRQHRHGPSSLRGAAAAPPTSQPPPVIAVFLPSSQPARDSCTQLIRASLESPRGGAAHGHICAGGTIASGTPGQPAPAPGAAGCIVLPSCAHSVAQLPPTKKRSVCKAAMPAGGTVLGEMLAGKV